MHVRFENPDEAPEALRAELRRINALSCRLADICNTCGESQPVVMAALINTYINAGMSWGKLHQVAAAMLDIGGQLDEALRAASASSAAASAANDAVKPSLH